MNLFRPPLSVALLDLAVLMPATSARAAPSAAGNPDCASVAGGATACMSEGEAARSTARELANGALVGAVAVAGGASHTCAIVAGGVVKCWGANNRAQFGNGAAQSAVTVPLDVLAWRGAGTLSAGSSFTCGAFAGGTVKCAGSNFAGQLGDGTNATRFAPTAVIGLGDTIFHNAFE